MTIRLDAEFKTIGNEEFYTISGFYYEKIMSNSPDFAPEKPKKEYRERGYMVYHLLN